MLQQVQQHNGIPQANLRETSGKPQGNLRHTSWIPQGYLRDTSGIPQGYLRHTSSIPQGLSKLGGQLVHVQQPLTGRVGLPGGDAIARVVLPTASHAEPRWNSVGRFVV